MFALSSFNKNYLILGVIVLALVAFGLSRNLGGKEPPEAWQPTLADEKAGAVPPESTATEWLDFGAMTHLRLAINLGDSAAQVTLRDPQGQEVAGNREGSTLNFELPGGAGAWQVQINNPSPNTTLNYHLQTSSGSGTNPGENPVTISPSTNSGETGQTVVISITVQETLLSVTSPISGAQVSANITCPPSTDIITIILQELDPLNQPGYYSGTFTGPPGATCQIEYVIDGTNSQGEPFVQTTTGEFTVPPSDSSTPTYTKKYDINWSGEVQIIGY